jgi:hypothetical protein
MRKSGRHYPAGKPSYIYNNPAEYGAENCGHKPANLKELIEESIKKFNLYQTDHLCKRGFAIICTKILEQLDGVYPITKENMVKAFCKLRAVLAKRSGELADCLPFFEDDDKEEARNYTDSGENSTDGDDESLMDADEVDVTSSESSDEDVDESDGA